MGAIGNLIGAIIQGITSSVAPSADVGTQAPTSGTSAATTGAAGANAAAASAAAAANAQTQEWINQQVEVQKQSAQAAMDYNREEAEKNRKWQEMMSNTQYQRAMADMKKAGLNPILAYAQGGAGVPSGATAQGVTISGAGGSAQKAEVFKGNEVEDIFQKIANTGLAAMQIISRL